MNKEQKNALIKSLDANIRYDGRKKDEYREIIIEKNISETAEGSAKVTIGDTIVMAGVKMDLGTPYSDSPDEGVLMVGVELSPIASNEFETGPPGIDSIELARVTDRGIRESKAIDNKKLCVAPGEKVWIVNVDITVINDDGNLFDACSIAALSAIKATKIPSIDKDGKADYHNLSKDKLPLSKEPIGVTVIKIKDHLIVDPTNQELKALDARLTITTLKDGSVCALQKGGEAPFTKEVVKEMVELSVKKGKELRKLL